VNKELRKNVLGLSAGRYQLVQKIGCEDAGSGYEAL